MQENLNEKVNLQENAFTTQKFTTQKSPYQAIALFLAILVVILSAYSFLSLNNRTVKNLLPEQAVVDDSVGNEVSNNIDSAATSLSDMLADDGQISQKIFPITSSYKAFVQGNKDGYIDVTPIDPSVKPYTVEKYGKIYDGGALGLGNTGLTLAPDLKKFAVINTDSVLIASVDGDNELKIDLKGVQYINGWSTDSNLLLVYVSSNSIKSNLESGGPGYEPPDQFDVDQNLSPGGFVLIDFKNGSMKHMTELDGMLVYAWVGSDGLILSSGMGQNETFVYYSLAEKMVDRKAVNSLNEVFGQQLSFTEDGKKWSTVTSTKKGSTEMAKATIGNFPNMGDIASIEFPWASRQRPTISPQGNLVALMGYEILNGPQYVYIFDGNNIEQITEGLPEMWIDDSQLIYSNYDAVSIYNVLTKKSTNLR